jgi:GT2 family glycosyltransferase
MSVPLSIVVCTYNRVDSLRRCVEALVSMETAYEWELVIVDNGSDNRTAEFLNSLPRQHGRVHLVTTYEMRRGKEVAINRGWKIAQGDIIAFTDDDCYVSRNYADAILAAFRSNTKLGFIGGRVLLYDQTDVRETIQERETYLGLQPRTFLPPGTMHGCNMAFRRETLETIGGFDECLPVADDVDALAAALWAGIAGAYDPGPTVYHHHRRKTERDVRNLGLAYDKGRGRYYIKYIVFNRESRAAYAKAWFRSVKAELRRAICNVRSGRRPTMQRSLRELYGALHYLWSRAKRSLSA